MIRFYFIGISLLTFAFLSASQAATITINSELMDEDGTDGLCTLVEAVNASNDNLASGILAGECVAGAVGLDDFIFDLPNGVSVIETQGIQLNVFEALSITGPGADLLTLDAQQQGPFFLVRAPLSLKGLTFENALGYAGTVVYQADPADLTLTDCVINNNIGESNSGGAIRVLGGETPTQLIVENCHFSNNTTLDFGGAIYIGVGASRHIDVQINNSYFINNSSENDDGGAISANLHDLGTASININNSRFELNSSGYYGGGVFLRGLGLSGSITQSTFFNNYATIGGGAVMFYEVGEFYNINNTFYANSAEQSSGAIYAWADNSNESGIHFINNTITNNSILTDISPQGGGGIYSRNVKTTLSNNVIAENITQNNGPDCSGSFTSNNYNFISDNTDCGMSAASGDLIGTGASPLDPMLNSAVDDLNFHVYQTPAIGSPLIDAGNPNGCIDEVGTRLVRDQMANFRHQDGSQSGTDRCDMGAIEVINLDVIFKDIFE